MTVAYIGASYLASPSGAPGTTDPLDQVYNVSASARCLVLGVITNTRNTVPGNIARQGGTPSIVGVGDFAPIGTAQHSGRADFAFTELYYYVNPPTGAQTIRVPNTQDITTSVKFFILALSSVWDIYLVDHTQTSGSSTAPGASVSKQYADSILVQVFCRFSVSGSVVSATGTSLYGGATSNSFSGYQYQGGAAGTTDVNYVLSASNQWATHIAEFYELLPSSGALAVTLDGATVAATGEVVTTSSAGTLAVTLDGATVAAQGSVVTPSQGTLSKTLDGATLAATGDVESLNPVGQLAVTLDGATVAAAGTVEFFMVHDSDHETRRLLAEDCEAGLMLLAEDCACTLVVAEDCELQVEEPT